MNILIYDENKGHAGHMQEICLKYLIFSNEEGETRIVSNEVEISKILETQGLIAVFFLDVGENLEVFTNKIREKSQQHYIVLMGESSEKIFEGITPLTRPAGCLLKPAQEQKVKTILEELLKDYKSRQKIREVFYFQIKAASYAVPCENILCFESQGKKIVLKTAAQEFEFYDTLSKIEERLPDYFMRVHKSSVVNLDKIEKVDFGTMEIYLEEDMIAYVSRSYKSQLVERMERRKRDGNQI